MRDILNLPQTDKRKLEEVKQLIDDIAENIENCSEELKKLESITGKQHTVMEFAEYWGWTDLENLAEITLTPEPPCVRDMALEEVAEIVGIMKESFMVGEDAKAGYYEELLHRSLPLADVMGYIVSDDSAEEIAGRMIQASKSSVIIL